MAGAIARHHTNGVNHLSDGDKREITEVIMRTNNIDRTSPNLQYYESIDPEKKFDRYKFYPERC